MKKWEYCSLGPITESLEDDLVTKLLPNTIYLNFCKENKFETTPYKIPDRITRMQFLSKIIAWLGNNGWELVCISPERYFYFKKEIE
ncbi:hypothetical protein SDC9_84496 [bioreactor metagenome]|uniref:Uncharacterized protein n=1 Tax=bioreactor metagenome TaxID=1076179 RepID=A0A644ZB18_9ZZZZ